MRGYNLFLLLLTTMLSAQNPPQIFVSTPQFIEGIADARSKVHISVDGNFVSDVSTEAGKDGTFKITYTPPLPSSVNAVFVWVAKSEGELSQYIVAPVETADTVLNEISNSKTNPYNKKVPQSTTLTYKATIMNTNFSVPIARFNFTSKSDEDKIGNILLFNSVGAGVGISSGRLTELYDEDGKVVANTFHNIVGIHFGAIFSAESGNEAKNVFAPVIQISILDFQVGMGYELGTISTNQKRTFLTLSYAIPLYKLTNTGFWIFLKERETVSHPKFSKTF